MSTVFTKKTCLFVISTSTEGFQFVKKQFETYDPSYFGMIVRIYDAGPKMETHTSSSITRIYFGGTKSKLWQSIGENEVQNYDYVWFMDDDLLFSKHIFPVDQFLHIVRTCDSVVSTPKSIRKDNKQGPHKATITSEMLGNQFAEEVDVIEVDSFMFKAEAWVFFHDYVLIEAHNSDWGPDCVWCQVFRINNFGKIPCLRSNHHGLIHMDSRTLTRGRVKGYGKHNAHKKTLALYNEKLRNLYNGTIQLHCDPTKSRYIGSENFV